MDRLLTRREIIALSAIALAGLLSYLSGFDYWLASAMGGRAAHGISLFISTDYFVLFELTGLMVVYLKNRKAAAALIISTILVFALQIAFTDFAPRARPPQALPIGDVLMSIIRRSGASSSFFSGHTASVIAVYATCAGIGLYPTAALLLAVPVIISRLLLVQHYLSDVLGGIIFGYVAAKAALAWLRVKA